MSTDEKVTSDLIETLKNGKEGFRLAAEKLSDGNRSDLSAEFETFSRQRSRFSAELGAIAKSYGDIVAEQSSVPGAIHRGWIAVKGTLTGSDPSAVLKAALTGEDHAVVEYETALKADISAELRDVVARQSAEVATTRDRVKTLADGS